MKFGKLKWVALVCLMVPMFASYFFDDAFSTLSQIFQHPESLELGRSLITVSEGRYHQVRRMMSARGMFVTYLRRVREGGLTLGDLEPGGVRVLSGKEVDSLFDRQNHEETDRK